MIRALSSLGRHDEAFDYNERARARAFLDVLSSRAQLARSGPTLEQERALQAKVSALRATMLGSEENSAETPRVGKELAEAQRAYNDLLVRVRKENREQASLMNVEPLTVKQFRICWTPASRWSNTLLLLTHCGCG
jgi:hypothetical protein